MSLWDWVLIALIALATGFAVRGIVRARKNGGCCGNCAACAYRQPQAGENTLCNKQIKGGKCCV